MCNQKQRIYTILPNEQPETMDIASRWEKVTFKTPKSLNQILGATYT